MHNSDDGNLQAESDSGSFWLQLAKRLLPMMISFLRELLLNFIGNVESFTSNHQCQVVSRVYDTLYQSFLDILERPCIAGRNVFQWMVFGVVTCNWILYINLLLLLVGAKGELCPLLQHFVCFWFELVLTLSILSPFSVGEATRCCCQRCLQKYFCRWRSPAFAWRRWKDRGLNLIIRMFSMS